MMKWIHRFFKLPSVVVLHVTLMLNNVTFGKRVTGNSLYIKNTGNIVIGDNVKLNSYSVGEPFRTGLSTHTPEARIEIGDHCIFNGAMLHCRTKIIIGNYCMFGPGVRIIDNDSHRVSPEILERRKSPNSKPIEIGNNVWIGLNCLVLKGVKVGNNSIVAAQSVVTKSIPENVIVAGNPAKIVKSFDGKF